MTTNEYPVFSAKQERDIFEEYGQTRSLSLRDKIFLHNRELVPPVAWRHVGRSRVMEFTDLVHEGYFGLFRAIDHFSLQRGTKFSTFATKLIDQSIARAVTNTGRLVRVPADMLTLVRKMVKGEKDYKEKFGVYPNPDTLRRIMGISVEVYRTVFFARRVLINESFDEMLDIMIESTDVEKRDIQVADILDYATDETAIGFSSLLEIQSVHAKVSKIVNLVRSRYNSRDAEVYLRLYGFNDFSFVREDVEFICHSFGLTKKQVEDVRKKCNKFVRKNIPDLVLSDFSEERCSALREIALVFE